MYHILDTETSGLGPNAGVCEIAWLEVDENLEIISEFESLVDPQVLIEEGAMRIHGITQDDVYGKPTLETVATMLPEKIVLVGHNCKFDYRMISKHITVSDMVCTLVAARKYIKNTTNHKLETLQRELGLPEQKSHSALGDVHTCRDLLLLLTNQFGFSLSAALADSKIPKLMHRMPFGKHKGKALTAVPADYRAWLLSSTVEIDKDLRFSLERLEGI